MDRVVIVGQAEYEKDISHLGSKYVVRLFVLSNAKLEQTEVKGTTTRNSNWAKFGYAMNYYGPYSCPPTRGTDGSMILRTTRSDLGLAAPKGPCFCVNAATVYNCQQGHEQIHSTRVKTHGGLLLPYIAIRRQDAVHKTDNVTTPFVVTSFDHQHALKRCWSLSLDFASIMIHHRLAEKLARCVIFKFYYLHKSYSVLATISTEETNYIRETSNTAR